MMTHLKKKFAGPLLKHSTEGRKDKQEREMQSFFALCVNTKTEKQMQSVMR